MVKHEVTITVDEKAGMTVEVKGLKGKACQEATKSLESLGTVTADTPTPEMQQREVTHERVRAGS